MTSESFDRIEHPHFSAHVNLASDLKTFLRAVRGQEGVRKLAAAMGEPSVRNAVCARAMEIVNRPADPAPEHPGDSAVAAYLLLLHGSEPALARLAAAAIPQSAEWWWSRKVAEKILSESAEQRSELLSVASANPAPSAAMAGKQ